MRDIDRLTTERFGIPSIQLMENAAQAVASTLKRKLGASIDSKSFLILCGKGNNGGDGAALARILVSSGAHVVAVLFGKIEETKGDARVNFERLKLPATEIANEISDHKLSFYETEFYSDAIDEILDRNFDVVCDSLFGTGLSRPIEGEVLTLIQELKELKSTSPSTLFCAIDIPSGLNSDMYRPIGENFHADITVTFTAPKLANVFPPASNFNGELFVADIGSPSELIDSSPSKIFVSEQRDAIRWLRDTEVRKDSYKKTRGVAVILAGSENYSGAAALVANSCFASGAGMVTLLTPKSIKEAVAAKLTNEIIVKKLEGANLNSEKTDVVAIGCGLSSDAKTVELIRGAVENRKTPMLLDAEALNALSPFSIDGSEQFPLILTPHIGEFSRLLGGENESIVENRIVAAREFASRHNVILVLKGERNLIASPDGRVVINPTGNAGISRAGAGDTLAGIITGFLAQSLAVRKSSESDTNLEVAFRATVAAVYVAGLAGDVAAAKFGERFLMAGDIRDCLKDAITQIGAEER